MSGYSWTEDVYKVLVQLNYMQKINPSEYYSKWVQTKISRLKITGKYSMEDLAKIEEMCKKGIQMEK